ncbi:MAG: hypothetical protein KJ634_08765 [Gammaproteobacteria bacterium]|nr:hypothetical protein [Gammaproteobacteria bacterium]MBU1415697.1 hypothetical protein [Gammaproteobacteria bacterium]
MKVLYLLGGSGGCWFWIEKWLERIRLQARLLTHEFDPIGGEVRVTIEFEVVNVGNAPTSLEPNIAISAFTPERTAVFGSLAIQEAERLLPPHSTRRIHAIGKIDARYPFWLFRSFRLAPNRGTDRVIRTIASVRKPVSWLRYDLQLTLFRWFRALPFVKIGGDLA